ncbi:MAG TPA: TOBE domain-containing protein [Actinomycetota bacterium]|nr:TOBE domain-containing protein [Actinomycetota bacterium]
MDEPLSNLDAKLRVQMRAAVSRLQQRLGTTTIYVTHDQTEAMTMGDRVAVMKKGELQQVAPPQELYDHPTNLFVAGFIGSPAMNLVDATLERTDGGMTVTFGKTRLALDESLVASRPALAAYDGRDVVLGIRPESLEDASLAAETTPDRRIRAQVDLRESLGSEVLIHFSVDAPPVLTEDTRELTRDLESGGAVLQEQERSRFVARLDPRTDAREHGEIELAVDTTRLHLFDPETGHGIHDETPDRVAVPAKGGTA